MNACRRTGSQWARGRVGGRPAGWPIERACRRAGGVGQRSAAQGRWAGRQESGCADMQAPTTDPDPPRPARATVAGLMQRTVLDVGLFGALGLTCSQQRQLW